MRKLKYFAPVLLSTAIVLPITSCNFRTQGKVTLIGIASADPVGVDGRDYWLCAEPAVTVKTKKLGLTNVGSVQTLYGSNGYNQAVLVCKKSLLSSNPKYLNSLQTLLQGNEAFVSNSSNTTNIINSIEHNTETTPTFSTTNTTTQTLINCNAKYVDQSTDLASYKAFLNKAQAVNKDVQKPNSESDYYRGFPSESETTTTGKYSIVCPDGAPAVGLANALCNSSSLTNETTFSFVKPDTIMQRIIQSDCNLAVLPSNMATKLYNEHDQKYVWLSTITWGNLYILSKNYTTLLTTSNLADQLYGKNMDVLQINAVPGLVWKIILKDNNINYVEA